MSPLNVSWLIQMLLLRAAADELLGHGNLLACAAVPGVAVVASDLGMGLFLHFSRSVSTMLILDRVT